MPEATPDDEPIDADEGAAPAGPSDDRLERTAPVRKFNPRALSPFRTGPHTAPVVPPPASTVPEGGFERDLHDLLQGIPASQAPFGTGRRAKQARAALAPAIKERALWIADFFKSRPKLAARLLVIRNQAGTFADRVESEFRFRPTNEDCDALSALVPADQALLELARKKNKDAARIQQKKDVAARRARPIKESKATALKAQPYKELVAATLASGDPGAIADLAASDPRFAAIVGFHASRKLSELGDDAPPEVSWGAGHGFPLKPALRERVAQAYIAKWTLARAARVKLERGLAIRRARDRERYAAIAADRALEDAPAVPDESSRLQAKAAARLAARPELLRKAIEARKAGSRALVDMVVGSQDLRALLSPASDRPALLNLTPEEIELLGAGDAKRAKKARP